MIFTMNSRRTHSTNRIGRRDKSRLMCLNKDSGEIEHSTFVNIINMLNPGDCLVMNRSKVIPARLFGKKKAEADLRFFFSGI